MPAIKRTIRTSQNIQTLTGRADQKRLPHKVFLRIACLEMERERLEQERTCARNRVRTIDDRIREIDEENGRLLAEIEEPAAERSPALLAPPAAPAEPGLAKCDAGGFKVRY